MPHGKEFSDYECGFIHASIKSGKTFSKIAEDLDRSASGVRQFAHRTTSKRRTGRPPSLSNREKRLILRTAANSELTSPQIKSLCNVNVTSKTIRNVIRRSPYIRKLKLKKKSRLTPHHIQERLNFGRKNMNRNWDKVSLKVQ